MELDKRFKVLPFCCFNRRTVINYIGKKGYFANDISSFRDINLCTYGTLEKIFCDRANSFQIKKIKQNTHFSFRSILLNQKKRNLDHIPLWNLPTHSQLDVLLNIDVKEM